MVETQEECEIHGEDDDDLLELGSEVEEEDYNYDEDEEAAAAKYEEEWQQQAGEEEDERGSRAPAACGGECSIQPDDVGNKQTAFTRSQTGSDDVVGLTRAAATAEDTIPWMIAELHSPDAEQVVEHGSRDDDASAAPEAICKRTRAHYSLVDMSLEELETFLQEPDEKDYFPNVNDQEEYQKFLAAVLEEGAAPDRSDMRHDSSVQEEEDEDDDDGDFVAEVEEALESDQEGSAAAEESGVGEPSSRSRHMVVTREKRRQRSRKRRVLCVDTGRLLRPLIPFAGSKKSGDLVRAAATGGVGGNVGHSAASRSSSKLPANGFTAHQIGQLHCLVHEHVQLLIQVFALSILEPSRQQIAIDTHKMLVEMAERRSAVLSWKKSAFPDFCFRPPYIHPSVTEDCSCLSGGGNSSSHDVLGWLQTSDADNADEDDDCGNARSLCHPPTNAFELEDSNSCTGNTWRTTCTCGSDAGGGAVHYAAQWTPSSSQPVRSLMDVAPLARVQEFLANIAKVVQQYMQRHVESGGYHSECEREPLFSTSKALQPYVSSGVAYYHEEPAVLSSIPHGKRTMAGALVESTKKQCIALVPKGVVRAIQIFLPHFNPALFPHKAPPPATANRLLFTDAEDGLLAMGLMTYNTDWKAIQQRFLPSKTVHQIFVRQKNRSSSRAPENPIKAVRRIKSSALTLRERECIYKALKLKYSWAKVWKYCVPYRNPALLRRQWRIAQGVQKSYKMNSSGRERHRLYEANRRRSVSYNKIVCLTLLSNQVTDKSKGPTHEGCYSPGDEEQQLLHGNFFAEWKPCFFQNIAAASAASSHDEVLPKLRRKRMKAYIPEHLDAQGTWGQTPEISTLSSPVLPSCSKTRLNSSPTSGQPADHLKTVQLSPDLPPVHLPPHGRVLSQRASRSSGGLPR